MTNLWAGINKFSADLGPQLIVVNGYKIHIAFTEIWQNLYFNHYLRKSKTIYESVIWNESQQDLSFW
jgi:ribosomal protein L13